MDREQFVALLNEDLETEYQSIVQYIHHIATAGGAEYRAVVDELRSHVEQELQHALTLATQIDFLGGEPTTNVPAAERQSDTAAALKADLELERHQLQRYRERAQQADELGLPDVTEALNPILEQTQDHVHELEKALETS